MWVLLGLLLYAPLVRSHGTERHFPINPELGVSGFPDCKRQHPSLDLSMDEASFDLRCSQRKGAPESIKIACVGDSITAGVHSSGGNHTYPFQLQMMLDTAHGYGAYTVTNLGACGSTMLKGGDSPYWKRPQFQTLVNNTWDIVTIMLGTNDAKDPGSGGPNNWKHECGGETDTKLEGCTFASDYLAMIDLIRSLGTTPAGPKIFLLVPPPLMQKDGYGMNETVINSVFPRLVPLIQQARPGVDGPVNIFTGMGGVSDWRSHFPKDGCKLDSSWAPCQWWCDAQSCDQCHPNDNGYHQLASVLYTMLAIPPVPTGPTPPPTPGRAGVWLYEAEGNGKLFVPLTNFSGNHNRGGMPAWDACNKNRDSLVFDNGHALWEPNTGPAKIGAASASGTEIAFRGAFPCGASYNYPNMSVSEPFSQGDGIRYDAWLYFEVSNSTSFQ